MQISISSQKEMEVDSFPKLLKDSLLNIGIYHTPMDCFNNEPDTSNLNFKSIQNLNYSFNLSLFDEGAGEYRTGVNHFFGYYAGINFYFNSNYKEGIIPGENFYYRVKFIGYLSYVTKYSYYEGNETLILFDYKNQKFIKISSPKGVEQLLMGNDILLNEYKQLKGREKRNLILIQKLKK